MNDQFEKSVLFPESYKTIESETSCREFKPVAARFATNLARVHSLGYLTLNINFWTANLTSAIVQAMLKLERMYIGQNIDDDVRLLANQGLSIFNRDWNKLSTSEKNEKIVDVAGTNIRSMIDNDSSGDLAEGHDAIMCAMITESWSAFEALSIDLWIAALDKYPDPLALKFAKSSGEKNITFDQLARYNFNINNAMGTAIIEFGKVRFDSINDIRANYKLVFGETVIHCLGDTLLLIAEKTRHLIAHRSGIVDKKYLDACSIQKPFCDFCIGERMPINGPMVADMAGACVQAGVALIHFVDNWSSIYAKSDA